MTNSIAQKHDQTNLCMALGRGQHQGSHAALGVLHVQARVICDDCHDDPFMATCSSMHQRRATIAVLQMKGLKVEKGSRRVASVLCTHCDPERKTYGHQRSKSASLPSPRCKDKIGRGGGVVEVANKAWQNMMLPEPSIVGIGRVSLAV
eukprot:1154472-Pelagomonas_calceolata.AAC.10